MKIAFRHAPGAAGMYAALFSSICSVAQILMLQHLVDGVYRYLWGTGSGGSVLLLGSLYNSGPDGVLPLWLCLE